MKRMARRVLWSVVCAALLSGMVTAADAATSSASREVVFRAAVPAGTPANQTVYLLIMPWRSWSWTQHVVLRQVTPGVMEGKAVLEEGSLVRYTYDRWDEQSRGNEWMATRECAGSSLPIDSRLLLVSAANAVVQDTVAAWADINREPVTGTLRGTVVDAITREPLPDTDITAGGIHIATRYDGTFEFPPLAVGNQRVTVYRSLGDHRLTEAVVTVQQGQTTEITLAMPPAQAVDVNFDVTLPEDTPADAEIRLTGSVYQMGGRISGSALNTPQMPGMNPPVMNRQGNRATLTLHMYDGTYAQYWYTVSDDWYGCEKGSNNDCRFRSLTISSAHPIQSDQVGTWRGQGMTRLSLYLTVPESTPVSTPVALVTGPAYWLTPVGHNQWVFHRYGYPGQSFDYSYALGAFRDEGAEAGKPTHTVTFGEQDTDVHDVITAWADVPGDWLTEDAMPRASLPGFAFTPPGKEFLRGFCPVDYWGGDAFIPLLDPTFRRIHDQNGGWVEVSSVWSYGTVSPLPTLESRPLLSSSVLIPRQDLVDEIRLAHEQGLKVLVGLQCNMEMTADRAALAGQHSAAWWQAWLEEAEAFWMWHAQVAEETGAEALLLPGYYFHAFPQKPDFESKRDARAFDEGVQSIIARVREVYHGKLVLGVCPEGFSFPSAVDWVGSTTFQTGKPDLPSSSGVEAWSQAYDYLFMRTLDPFYWAYQKPVVIYQMYVPYESAAGDPAGESSQARQLQGLLSALSKRSWVVGTFSFGYMPIDAPLVVPHCSVRGRLAEDVLAKYYQE
jgi:hypothetical protein